MEKIIYGMFGYLIFTILYLIIYTQYVKWKKKNSKMPLDENGNIDLFQGSVYEKPKRISFEFYNNISSTEYIHLPITPYLDIIVDKQGSEGFMTSEGEVIYGIIEYKLDLNWLGFVVGITYTKLTDMWIE